MMYGAHLTLVAKRQYKLKFCITKNVRDEIHFQNQTQQVANNLQKSHDTPCEFSFNLGIY